MKLIGSLTSPFVRKVRVVMLEKKLSYSLQIQDMWAHDQPDPLNPLGKVPCLLLEGGASIYDSSVIVEYLDALSPGSRLIPAGGRERAEVRTWEALADGVVDALVAMRLENTWSGRTPEQRSERWIERQKAKVHAGLAAMAAGLSDKAWCCGTQFTLADIAVGCAFGFLDLRFPDILWRQDHPGLAKLSEKILMRSSFIETAPTKM
jgi:glutathione S-transferase